jgi:glycosyltransferase involved in cell wall biosynthesis
MASTKKKILFVNGHLNVGGIEKSLADLLKNLDDDVYDIDLLLLEDKGTYVERLPKSVHVLYRDPSHVYGPLFKTFWNNLLHRRWGDIAFRLILFLAPKLGEWILKALRPVLGLTNEYDCAIAYRVGKPNEIVSLVVKAKKKVCWWHNGECNYSPRQIQHIRDLWKNMDAIVAVSNGCKQMIVHRFGVDEKKVSVIPNIIDVASIQRMAGEVNPYTDNANVRLVTLGRLCWEKHIEDVPEIARHLIEQGHHDFKWYIIGDAAKYNEIEAKIKNDHLEEHVFMLGRIDNPYPYLKFADMMVHTSYVEAHCLTLLEAMSLMTPCVATKTNLHQDFTEDSVNCLLAEQSIESQTASTARMISHLDEASVMVRNAFEMVCERYSVEAIIPQVGAIFKS